MANLSHAEVLRLRQANVDFAKPSEEFTEILVENAAPGVKGCSRSVKVYDVLLRAEDVGARQPLNSILTLMIILNKVNVW